MPEAGIPKKVSKVSIWSPEFSVRKTTVTTATIQQFLDYCKWAHPLPVTLQTPLSPSQTEVRVFEEIAQHRSLRFKSKKLDELETDQMRQRFEKEWKPYQINAPNKNGNIGTWEGSFITPNGRIFHWRLRTLRSLWISGISGSDRPEDYGECLLILPEEFAVDLPEKTKNPEALSAPSANGDEIKSFLWRLPGTGASEKIPPEAILSFLRMGEETHGRDQIVTENVKRKQCLTNYWYPGIDANSRKVSDMRDTDGRPVLSDSFSRGAFLSKTIFQLKDQTLWRAEFLSDAQIEFIDPLGRRMVLKHPEVFAKGIGILGKRVPHPEPPDPFQGSGGFCP